MKAVQEKSIWQTPRCLFITGLLGLFSASAATGEETSAVDAAATDLSGLQPTEATLGEIEACAERNLQGATGIVRFAVDAIDRSGTSTTSRAELRWRKPEDEQTRILLVVSEPAKTAGTALLMIDRDAKEPEFFVRLPEMEKVKQIRSRRLKGPVLGTDFSYEDLERLRGPLERTNLTILGEMEVDGRRVWVLETIPSKKDRSEYSRVLTYVDESVCLPLRVELFEEGRGKTHRLRKRLETSVDAMRPVSDAPGAASLPYEFVMHDLERVSRTVIRIEGVEVGGALSAEQFTRAALAQFLNEPADPSAEGSASSPPAP